MDLCLFGLVLFDLGLFDRVDFDIGFLDVDLFDLADFCPSVRLLSPSRGAPSFTLGGPPQTLRRSAYAQINSR